MPASRKKAIKKSSKKITTRRSTRPQRGRISEKLIIVLVVVLLLLGVGIWFFKPWQYFSRAFVDNSSPVVVVKPHMDMGRARQMTIYPDKDNIMQIVTQEKVRVTLEVPKGAIKEKTVVQLIPFYNDAKSKAPTSGVIVGPAAINFDEPVTLSFNFSESKYKNQAPKTVLEKKLRTTGLSQVMQVDAKATSLTPTLIAREIETETYLPARILTGGAYVFSLDGSHQIQNARKALDTEGMHTLVVMESSTVLLFNNQQLSEEELKKTKAAVAKILSKKTPPAFEYYAALVLQKKIKNPTFSLIPKVYAYDTPEGFFQVACKEDTGTVEDYIGFAKVAQLMGNETIGKSCLDKAKNKVTEETKKILAGNPDLKTVMVALKDVQFLGLDDETNLDEQLVEKAKEVATEAAKKVANDPNSSAVDAAIQMQQMEAVGADSGPTYDALKQRMNDVLDQQDKAVDQASEDYQRDEAKREADIDRLTKEAEKKEKEMEDAYKDDSIDDEEILYSQAMSALGIGLLQAFGFEELDKDSLKKKFDEMESQTREMLSGMHEWCAEMQAEGYDDGDCEAAATKADGLLKEAEDLSYRVENEIGDIQSRDYEEPDYLQNNGEYEFYFDEDLTPTPEEGSDVEEYAPEDYQDENQEDNQEGSQFDSNDYGPESQDTNSDDSSNDSEINSQSGSEDVQGTSTWRWWPFLR